MTSRRQDTPDGRRYAITALVFVALVAAGLWRGTQPADPGAAIFAAAAPLPQALRGTFHLVGHDGRQRTDDELLDGYSLVFFGYTSCPDICPTAMGTMTEALDLLESRSQSQSLRPVFITVDPERDTVERLREFVAAFDDRLLGLTGDPREVTQAARAFRVHRRREAIDGLDPDDYMMSHSAYIYLMGPDGRFITAFEHGVAPRALADEVGIHL